MANSSTLNVIINVSQTGSATLGRVTSGLKNLGAAAAKAAVTGLGVASVAAVGLGAKLVTMGSSAEEMLGKFNVVFGSMAGAVTTQLTDFASEVGRSRFELMGFASTIQDTLVPLGFARDAAAAMSTDVVKLATDLGSFNDIPTSTVIEDIQSALVGNTETLRKYGVVASQAAIEQFALTNNLWDGEAAMDAQTKAAAIMGLIVDSTTDAQGDAARTSESWANQMRGLKALITDTGTEIGLKLLPAVTPLLQKFVELATNALPSLLAALDPFIEALVEIGTLLAAGDIEGALTRAFGSETAQKIITVAGHFKSFITDTVIPFVQNHGPALGAAFTAIGGLILAAGIATLIGAIITPIGLLITAVGLLAFAWAENWGGIQEKTMSVLEFINVGIGNLGPLLENMGLTFLAWGEFTRDNFWVPMTQWVNDFLAHLGTAKTNIATVLAAAGQTFLAWGAFVSTNVWIPLTQKVNDFLALIGQIAGAISGAVGAVNEFFNNLPADLPGLPTGQTGSGTGGFNVPPPSGQSNSSPGFSSPSGTAVTNNYVMNVNGGDVGAIQNEFGAKAAAAGGI